MYLIVICGETGSGKSVLTKEFVRKSKLVSVYDIQNEYEDLKYYPESKERFRINPRQGLDLFVSICNSTRGFLHVIEESTGVFSSRISKPFTDAILSKRHDNNTYIIVSHQLNKIPTDLMGFADLVILFRTGDLKKNIKNKYPEMLDSFNYLQTSEKQIREPSGLLFNNDPSKWANLRGLNKPNGPLYINDYITIKKSNLSKNL